MIFVHLSRLFARLFLALFLSCDMISIAAQTKPEVVDAIRADANGFCKLCALRVQKLRAKKACIEQLASELICTNSLKANVIDAPRIVNNALSTHSVKTDNLCATNIDTVNLCVDNLNLDNALCANSITAQNLCAQASAIDNLWTRTVISNNVCVSGNVEHCTAFKAIVNVSNLTTYTLGTKLSFDTIIDDPNNDIINSNPTQYLVPRTGYYIVSLETGLNDVVSLLNPVAGIPVVSLEVFANNTRVLRGSEVFLSFAPQQDSVLTGIINLNAGDILTATLNLLALDSTGAVKVAGTVVLDANSSWTIHYLSSSCPDGVQPCQPSAAQCTPCSTTVTCPPCPTVPRLNGTCVSCEHDFDFDCSCDF